MQAPSEVWFSNGHSIGNRISVRAIAGSGGACWHEVELEEARHMGERSPQTCSAGRHTSTVYFILLPARCQRRARDQRRRDFMPSATDQQMVGWEGAGEAKNKPN